MKRKSHAGILLALAVVVLAAIFGGLFVSRNLGKSTKTVSRESSQRTLEKMIDHIEPQQGTPTKGTVEYAEEDTTFQELPELKDDSIVVNPTGSNVAEIFASSEKTGSGRDGFLREMASSYNAQKIEVNGQPAAIR
ncbi:MAG: VWA domain-containing protein, partial [Lachnospiraceae bacterium]|nr:VWA domain-containing protein [Lachnospiraceae bacterium]